MMTRIVKILFFLGIILLVVCLVAPSFIDWNQHKPEVMARISPYFQRKIDVGGNVSFRILPQPEILLGEVTVANAAGSMKDPLMTLKSLEAHISLEPLLEGRVEVEMINLTEPVLNLDINADGKTSLSGVLSSSDDVGAVASAVQLNKVTISNGMLHYTNQLTGAQKTFENLNLAVKADTLLGPYHISGDMQYQKTNANINIDTEAFDKSMSTPTHISFIPSGDMPQVKLNGALDLHAGMDIEGEVGIKQGKLGNLFNISSLSTLDFMNDAIDLTGTMAFKGDQFSLNDIKAKFGKEGSGSLHGKVSIQYPRKGNPAVQADLEGNNLTVTGKPSDTYMDVPADYQGSLHFKGKNIVWDGRHLDAADISVTFKDRDWAIKSAQVSLPGNSEIKLSGTVMPKVNSAAYTSFQLTTNDLGKMVDSFVPADTSIFSILGGAAAPFKKLALTSNLEISPAKISFFNIDATLEDKEKVSGVLNVDRVTTKQNVTAKLHLSSWDSSAFPDGFVQAIMKSDADMEITADNFAKGNLKVSDLSFKGKTDDKGLDIEDLSGHLSDKDHFSLNGHVTSLAPISGLDVSYTLKAKNAADIAKNMGLDLPPLTSDNSSLKGTIKDDAGKYDLTVQGTADGLELYGQHITHPSFSLDITPSAVKLSELTGTIWDGKLNGDVAFTQQQQPAPSWSTAFKGSVKQVDLPQLQDLLGLKGFTTGTGDIDFDLVSADNTIASATGSVAVQTSNITVKSFNADKLGDTLHQLTTMPDNLQQLVNDTCQNNGSSVFKNVQGHFKIDHGKVNIETLNLINASEKMPVTGSADITAGRYTISGNLQLLKPEDFPALKMTANEKEGYKVDSKPLEDYVIKHLPPPPPAAQPPATPVTVSPPVTTPTAPVPPIAQPQLETPPAANNPAATKEQPIGDILKRLDESNAPQAPPPQAPEQPTPPSQAPVPLTASPPAQPPVPPSPAVPPAVPAQPDINKMMQKMQMQELMQQQNDMPLPLTPTTP